jgi:hypothetical protein
MRPGLPTPAADERGFILVGVVMFMIALTILGLSLFALSSYEAQFFYASQSREQSLQSSESGMEVVKALLSDPAVPSNYRYRLEAAQLAVGHYGITRALAYQARSSDPNDTTSHGPVNWDSTVVIVVSARAGGEERAVQSRFVPVPMKSPYHELLCSSGSITYNLSQGSPQSMTLQGGVWQPVQTATDSAWTGYIQWSAGRPIDPNPPPAPTANAFVDLNRPSASNPDGWSFDPDNTPYEIRFDNPSSSPKFYLSPASPPLDPDDSFTYPEHTAYEFFSEYELNLKIHGTVIWLVNQGVCFRRTVTVMPDGTNDPTNPNVLVIIAKPNLGAANPNRGIWFQGGLVVGDSTQAKVFLVSQGDVSLTQVHNSHNNLSAEAVSIVAGGSVELEGSSSATFNVTHAASMNTIADNLLSGQWLPAMSGGSAMAFTPVPHSWLETRLP